ncbi:DUF3617 domain-containing protein [Hyphomicrobium sp.]|jgi:hypothetical protein|uniref:DUF3617 domain-containing protein n=1 Tax=Hyphomicrobium sp. TaxID=82 RepID=UPI002CAE1A5B|nr:DUF3617 family protein [Hyphomicrobium sp.]HVZ04863.1 DUF3617 family protein [Hyphomicrobium sp.]
MPKMMYRLSLFAMFLAVFCFQQASAFAASLPVRKPGLWEITTVADNFGMKRFKTCISDHDSIAPGIGDKNCDPPEITSGNSEAIVNITCRMKGGTQLTSMLLSGDFQKWYRATSKITFKFPDGRESRDGVTVTAKFLGQCSASDDQKPDKAAHSVQ